VLDPPKFIFTRDEHGNWEGRQKYEDLNLLAISLVKLGGIFVTCSCSGLLSLEDFEAHVIKAAHRQNRRLRDPFAFAIRDANVPVRHPPPDKRAVILCATGTTGIVHGNVGAHGVEATGQGLS
jgi:hypothetical protein